MAEFCFDCLQKLDGCLYDPKDFIISDDLDLCEGCGEWKHVVVVRRSVSHLGLLGVLTDALKSLSGWINQIISG